MILSSYEKLELHKRYVMTVVDISYVEHSNQPFIVTRETTFEEWASQEGLSQRATYICSRAKELYFYEVISD